MNKNIIIGLAMLTSFFSCQKEEFGTDVEIRINATIENNGVRTKGDGFDTPENGQVCYLYIPQGSFKKPNEQMMFPYTYNGTKWNATNALFWDDILAASNPGDTQFYFSSSDSAVFEEGCSDDILWGEATGWKSPLNFELSHSMAKLSFVFIDKTLKNDIDFDNSKVVISNGLYRKIHNFDFTNGEVSIDPVKGEREKETYVRLTSKDDVNKTATLELGTVPPQEFSDNTRLEITAGDYVYRIPLPTEMSDTNENKEPIELLPGEHLTINVTLTENEINLKAKLIDWVVPAEKDTINVSRVFNIGSWEELKDLMLAVNTGYTFKGMVVRLTQDIVLGDNISLGSEQYAFEGVFDGNGKKITNLGKIENSHSVPNIGGLFKYTKGATIQNVTLIAPIVYADKNSPVGALIDKAEDTTIFNCSVIRASGNESNDAGVVNSKYDCVGGLVGQALGFTSLSYCYAENDVIIKDDENAEKKVSVNYVGGLVGYSEGTITHCSAQGAVEADLSKYVGGLLGYGSNTVFNCFAWGSTKGHTKVGGLIGHIDALVSNSYAEGDVFIDADGEERGGLLGSMGFSGDAKYCLWKHNESYKGIGSATLDATCTSFAKSGVQEVIDRLNTNSPDTWVILANAENPKAIFKNR